ncbi:hypothetical protein L6452_08885 [Arctium lappa]|uniref:Uncharacterized protein n=1 Tax=Arctium lappa TaxID=4217 RepID=A0ACB9DIZ8_ARCLA|nr:hypothetical protein L6452_08885 [Arctium lappa]
MGYGGHGDDGGDEWDHGGYWWFFSGEVGDVVVSSEFAGYHTTPLNFRPKSSNWFSIHYIPNSVFLSDLFLVDCSN